MGLNTVIVVISWQWSEGLNRDKCRSWSLIRVVLFFEY